MKTNVCVMMGVLAMVGGVVAQEAKPPALLAKGEDGNSSPLRVDEVDVAVTVVGNVAETVMTMRFRNDTDRVLEGELVFPLGEGRTVSRYGLEVNGKMREGVSVPKKRGRAVFDSVVRKEIDPGLLEWTKGNNFRTRIYPIPAKGFKSVRVGYEEELAEQDGKYVYRLPMDYKDVLGTFRMRMEVERTGVAANEIEVEGLKLQRRKARTVIMEAEEKNFAADRTIVVRLAQEQGPSVRVEERDGEQYFYLVDRPEVPAATGARERPESVRLVWDASHSGGSRDVVREMAVLDRYLAWVGEATVELVWLRNDLEKAGSFTVEDGKCEALRKVLEEVRYDGGTRLDLLDFREVTEDAVLLVTDGIATLGKPEVQVGTVPVMVLHASPSAEHGVLRGMARKSGGVYVNAAESGVEAAAKLLTEQPFSLLEVTLEGGGNLAEVYPSGARAVNGVVGVAGMLASKDAVTFVLRYGGGGVNDIVRRVPADPAAHASTTGRVPRLWAQKKLEELEVDAERNRDAIMALAKGHGLVTRYTSLIVLDGVEDYVEHRIVPPEPEMRKEYEELLKEEPGEDRGDPEHLKKMLALWKKRCQWHDTKFPGLEKVLFLRFDQVAPEIEDLREGLKELEEEDEELDDEEKKLVAVAKEKLREFDHVRTEVAKLRGVAQEERGAEWLQEVTAVSARFGELIASLESTVWGEAGGGGGADPFAAPGAVGGALLRRSTQANAVPAPMVAPSNGGGDAESDGADDPFGGGGDADGAMPSEEYEPPELPNSVGGGGGGIFPVTPATPTGFVTKSEGGEIALAKWNPKTPYLEALKNVAADGDLEAVYFEWKEKNKDSSAFFLDVADFFRERNDERLALRILTNVAEMDLESVPLLRILGHRLDQLGELELAELVFREVKALRGDEPQSWRDLALILEKRERYQEALDLLWSMVMFEWDGRFPEVQLIALIEMNALVARQGESLNLSAVDERFLRNLDCDVRIVLTWDADNTDMDLWVTGPAGEKCFYENPDTLTGGHMSKDFTGGYGPEEFVIRRALPGNYRVEVDYYGNEQQVLAGATTVQAVLITNWGRPNEKREAVTLRLKDEEEMVKVGELKFGGAGGE